MLEFDSYTKVAPVDAAYYTGDNLNGVLETLGDKASFAPDTGLTIYTLEGPVTCPIGHLVMRGAHGEFWPCDPTIFGKTYRKNTNAN